jgi:hypothetical protein
MTGLLGAQEQPAATAPATTTAAAATTTATTQPSTEGEPAEERSSYEIRNMFSSRVRDYPPELAKLIALDPSLLSNDAFLAGYPNIARFVSENPEIRQNPRFYLADFRIPGERESVFDKVFEALMIFATFVFIAFALAWLVRTVIEQKRWNRLSRTQSEVHSKILDRFSSSEELLTYVRTPAGSKFLESAPIPLHADAAPQNVSLTRVLWSIQVGIVIAAGAIGMLIVSGRLDKDDAQALFAMGTIAFCVGGGFVASAVVSMIMSRRLGLWQGRPTPADALEHPDA